MENRIIFGIYDSRNNFLGYKVDSFWSLLKMKENAKTHRREDAEISSNLFKNLLYFCNEGEFKGAYKKYLIEGKNAELDERGKFEILVEDFKTGKEISKYVLTHDESERYYISKL